MTATATISPSDPALDALEIDTARRSASVAGEELYLSEPEFVLLSTIAAEPGRLFSHAELGEVSYAGVERIERCAERLARKLELRGLRGRLRRETGFGVALELGIDLPGEPLGRRMSVGPTEMEVPE